MKLKWYIFSKMIGWEKYYGAYRILDLSQPDHIENREYIGSYTTDRKQMKELITQKNAASEENGESKNTIK